MKNYTIIIFGGTGDLTKRKLAPALSALCTRTDEMSITLLGIGRSMYTDEEYQSLLFPKGNPPKELRVHYFNADVTSPQTFAGLHDKLKSVENSKTDGRIFYLSTSYDLFERIAKIIAENQLSKGVGFSRIIVEKPFGHDHASSKKLSATLNNYFSEEQIYRADHYLAKDTIDNILRLRFSNPLFESVWNSEFITTIRVTVDEELGVGSRIEYYDGAGAIRDMVQNHLLQTLSLVLMEAPASLYDEDFKKAKIAALEELHHTGKVLTGQYEGYVEEAKKIRPSSTTETFVDVELRSQSKRWSGTSLILRTGKRLNKSEASIEIEFKKEPCMYYCNLDSAPNKLILHIQPMSSIELVVNTTLPGEEMKLSPVRMSFTPSCEFRANSPEGYEVILRNCIQGNKNMFISTEELDAAWKLTDEIIVSAQQTTPKLYAQGSTGPLKN